MNFPLVPDQASTLAPEVDAIAIVLTLLTVFFTVLVMTLLIVLAVRYRRGSRANRKGSVSHNTVMELGWSIPPLVLGLMMFAWNVVPYARIYNPPKNAEEIFVIGKQWMWHMQHTNGIRENNELHIPMGRPFKLTIISQDVIHGFYVPDFRVKRDAMPGSYNTVWFEATKPGKHHLFCSEYCGTNHSQMGGWIYVMTPTDYEKWVASGGSRLDATPRTARDQGAELFTQLACGNCHKSDDTARAPSLVGLLGRQRTLQSGVAVTADENYIRKTLIKPEDTLLAGWPATMPSYKEQLTEEQIHDLVVYIKSLGPGAGAGSTGGRAPARGAQNRPASQQNTMGNISR